MKASVERRINIFWIYNVQDYSVLFDNTVRRL